MFLSLKTLTMPGRGGVVLLAAAAFAAGISAGALVLPGSASRAPEAPAAESRPETARPAPPIRTGYPAEVLRVLDGDTFEARVRIWPGHDVTTRVRLRNIDAPEMKARCDDEREKAIAARDFLARLLEEGAVAISNVGQDKYGGRVDADASTRRTPDVGLAILDAGLARRYGGGRRESWCAAQH